MLVILFPEDLEKNLKNKIKLKNIKNYQKLNVSIKGIYNGDHDMLEILKDDIILYKQGNKTTIIKNPSNKY